MPSLSKNFLDLLRSKFQDYPVFVETGTYQGETILAVEPYFKELFTIEIKPEFYQAVKAAYEGSKINFILGDSGVEIDNLVQRINANTIFFLDGHWSAGNTGRGSKDCPLVEEIQSISQKFRHEAIIIIDDFRLFGKGPKTGEICDWEDISEDHLTQILKPRLTKHYYIPSEIHPKDRLVYHIKAI